LLLSLRVNLVFHRGRDLRPVLQSVPHKCQIAYDYAGLREMYAR